MSDPRATDHDRAMLAHARNGGEVLVRARLVAWRAPTARRGGNNGNARILLPSGHTAWIAKTDVVVP